MWAPDFECEGCVLLAQLSGSQHPRLLIAIGDDDALTHTPVHPQTAFKDHFIKSHTPALSRPNSPTSNCPQPLIFLLTSLTWQCLPNSS